MTPEEFRQAGHELIDWIADYRSNLEQRPVRAQVAPAQIKNSLPSEAPTSPRSAQQMLYDLEDKIVPGITQVQHPMHFGWFPSNASLASTLGDIASSGLGTLGISWESCPALTEVEEVVCDWLRQLTGLSENWEGCIQDTASTSCLTALLLARERASEFSQNKGGLQSHPQAMVIYTTAEAHSSVAKSALLAGFGKDNLRLIEMDPLSRAMRAQNLEEQVANDIRVGLKPAAVVASVGSTGVTAFDPVAEIAEIATRHGFWLHVDAAMAGSAMLLPECRHLWEGVEAADSISWNPHKWMGTILDCSLFYVRDVQHLVRVMSTNPSYLRSTVDAEVRQYRDWGIPLGRRFRALKLWYHLGIDGIDSIRERLRRDLDNSRWFAQQVEAAKDWRVLAPVDLQTVCIRHEPPGVTGEALDQHTLAWVNAINQSGEAFMSPSILDGRWMLRVSIGVEATTRAHIEKLWKLIRQRAQGPIS
ncbi:MAG: aminotransferase class V-fold PLP-dependent enzyme [Gammaproteobacteria bacterium]|nr:aminotransferase class V-fold PLP-dependent enzyme [Gammaproteobacteria bacterium]MCP4980289.1 aminotransferase class V-fold PLP-dependent enzyme [Gammaproteobacteria bacterium]